MSQAQTLLAASRYGQRRRRREPTPEGGVLRAILEGLAARRVFARRMNSRVLILDEEQSGRARRRLFRAGFLGCPDVYVHWPNRGAGWIEVKAPGQDLTAAQRDFRDECLWAGVLHVVARSWEDVEAFLGRPHA